MVHTLQYRSADNAGNVETAGLGQVKIDPVKPVDEQQRRQPDAYRLVHPGADRQGHRQRRRRHLLLRRRRRLQAGTSVTMSGRGRHTVKFYSVDNAGNVESTKSATVRIG